MYRCFMCVTNSFETQSRLILYLKFVHGLHEKSDYCCMSCDRKYGSPMCFRKHVCRLSKISDMNVEKSPEVLNTSQNIFS